MPLEPKLAPVEVGSDVGILYFVIGSARNR